MATGIKHAAAKDKGDKGEASEWNDKHVIDGDFDCNKYSPLNMAIENRTDYPANPNPGQIIFRTDLNMIMHWNGTAWIGAIVFTKQTSGPPEEEYDEGTMCINPADAVVYVRTKFPVATPDTLFYKLDEGTGTDVNDSSGNVHHGISDGEWWVPGKYSNGFDLTGTRLITVPGHVHFDFHEEFSFSMWIKRTGAWNDGDVIFERMRDATHYYRLYYSAVNGLTFRWVDPVVREISVLLTEFPLGTWVFLSLGAWFNVAGPNYLVSLQVNVSEPGSQAIDYQDIPFQVADNLIIGNGINASIDDFKMWNSFRSAVELPVDAVVSDTPIWTYAYLYPYLPWW